MSRKHSFSLLAWWLLLTATFIAPAWAEDEAPPPALDEIRLKNGSTIFGEIIGARDGTVTVNTDFAGELNIALDQVEVMNTATTIQVLLADDSVVEAVELQVDDTQLLVDAGTPEEQSYDLAELAIVNPEPWEMGQGYDWTGLVSFAFAIERGNSKTDELDYKLDSIWRSARDRYTLKLTGEIDEANDQKNADNWLVIGKYDYYVSEVTYWGVNMSAESDEFKDLDLRYLVGPYIGRDFFTDPVFTLAAEVGASYVNEDFITAEDNEYPAANWTLRMTSNYLGGDSLLYLDQRGIWNLDENSDVVVNTGLGLSFPLFWRLEAAAEILWEYDSGAVEGVDELDESYKLRIGYTW